MHDQKKTIRERIFFSLMIICVYYLGKNIPLPWAAYNFNAPEYDTGLQSVISDIMGSTYDNFSLFSLGFMPYMAANITFMMLRYVYHEDSKRVSSKDLYKRTLVFTVIFAACQGYIKSVSITFRGEILISEMFMRIISTIIMIAGSMIMMALADMNTAHGIGGRTLLILTNLIHRIGNTFVDFFSLRNVPGEYLGTLQGELTVLLVALAIVNIAIFLNKTEVRAYCNRIMIHSTLSTDDYIPIRLSPSGVMPLYFVLWIFTAPFYLCQLLLYFFPDHPTIIAVMNSLDLNNMIGIIVFGLLIIALSIMLGMVAVNPAEAAENMQKSGDCISGIQPGKPTRDYLSGIVHQCGLTGGLCMALVVCLPLVYKMIFQSDSPIYNLPMTMLIMISSIQKLLEEVRILYAVGNYKTFL